MEAFPRNRVRRLFWFPAAMAPGIHPDGFSPQSQTVARVLMMLSSPWLGLGVVNGCAANVP